MKFNNIRSQILLSFGAIVFLVVVAVSITFYYTVSNTTKKDIRTKELLIFIEASQSELRSEFEKAIETSLTLANDPTLNHWFIEGGDNEVFKQLNLDKLDAINKDLAYFLTFAADNHTKNFWADGHRLLDVLSPDDSDDSWYFDALKSGQRVQTNLDYNRELNQTGLFINVVMGDMDAPTGVAGVGLNLDKLVKGLSTRKFSANSNIWVVDNSGLVKLAQSIEQTNVTLSSIIGNAANELVSSLNEGVISNYDIGGEDFELAYMNIGETGHKIVMSVPTEELVSMLKPIRNYSIVIGLFFVIIALVLAYFISRSLAEPILKLNKVANVYAEGKLNTNIDESISSRGDEIGQLAASLTNMVSRFKVVIGSVLDSADNISSASQQLSSGSQQISTGVSEQAASTEELSSSMEEMTENIQQNTENAVKTREISIKASKSMEQLAEASVNSMDAVKDIYSKINVVVEIAEKTDLLAINAAVEAARAGEQGRGFAVVAAEVRKLAERSQLAANDIVGLAERGAELTEESTGMLKSILPDIQETYRLVDEISNASRAQETGVLQINNALHQLSNVTQENASNSEEMASNSEEMASQAAELEHLGSFFKLDENIRKQTAKTYKNRVGTNGSGLNGHSEFINSGFGLSN